MTTSDLTTNLALPFLAAAQAQKHVTVNESLRLLDALVQPNVISRVVSAQPGSPTDGDVYILPPGKTGAAWGAMTNGAVAYWRDGAWAQITPREGWTFYVRDEDQHVVFSGAAWGPILSAAQTAGYRNRLVNGAFAINQRGATSVADDAYCFDRWYILTSTGAVTVGALTDPESGRITGIRLTQPDATAKRIGLAQIVESADIRDLRSRAVAMAARIRCTSAQAIRMAILEHTGTADTVISDVVNSWTSGAFTPGNFFIAGVNVIATGASTPAANTWTDLTQITGAFGATLTNAIVMVWTETVLAQSGALDLDQAQLEPGAICGAFACRPPGAELALCQRTHEILGIGTTGGWYAASGCQVGGAFKVTKRTTPALSLNTTTPTVADPGIANRTGSGSSLATQVASPSSFVINIDGFSGATASRPAVVYTDCIVANADL